MKRRGHRIGSDRVDGKINIVNMQKDGWRS